MGRVTPLYDFLLLLEDDFFGGAIFFVVVGRVTTPGVFIFVFTERMIRLFLWRRGLATRNRIQSSARVRYWRLTSCAVDVINKSISRRCKSIKEGSVIGVQAW